MLYVYTVFVECQGHCHEQRQLEHPNETLSTIPLSLMSLFNDWFSIPKWLFNKSIVLGYGVNPGDSFSPEYILVCFIAKRMNSIHALTYEENHSISMTFILWISRRLSLTDKLILNARYWNTLFRPTEEGWAKGSSRLQKHPPATQCRNILSTTKPCRLTHKTFHLPLITQHHGANTKR